MLLFEQNFGSPGYMIGKYAFHYFIAQGTTVFMIITLPNQIERFNNRYCTEQNNEHVITTEYLFTCHIVVFILLDVGK